MSSSQKKVPQKPTQEFVLRFPTSKKYYEFDAMCFNKNLNADLSSSNKVKMERENNSKKYKITDDDMPKFGAGSEFGREAREEARRKKFGATSKKYNPDNQPWLLKCGGKDGKKFKSLKGSGINSNSQHYIFANAPDGAIEIYPLREWHNFKPVQRFKAFSAEEAEEEYSRRNNVYNYFNLMAKRKARGNEEEEEAVAIGSGSKKTKKDKNFKISEIEDWIDSDEDSDSDMEKDDDEDGPKKSKKKSAAKKKKKNVSDDEAVEESDDGDEEGRECEYISDSSESETELELEKQVKSVAEEDALRNLLISDDEDEDEENEDKKNKDENDDKDKEEKNNGKSEKPGEKKKEQPKKKKVSSSESSFSDSDSDVPKEKDKKINTSLISRSATPTEVTATIAGVKRKQCESPDISQARRQKLDNFNLAPSSYTPSASDSVVTEEAVRRYLARKPITTIELLQKFKLKKSGLSSGQLVNTITQILKKINPVKQTIKNKLYLSLPKA